MLVSLRRPRWQSISSGKRLGSPPCSPGTGTSLGQSTAASRGLHPLPAQTKALKTHTPWLSLAAGRSLHCNYGGVCATKVMVSCLDCFSSQVFSHRVCYDMFLFKRTPCISDYVGTQDVSPLHAYPQAPTKVVCEETLCQGLEKGQRLESPVISASQTLGKSYNYIIFSWKAD